jgi:fructose-specific phosphotransferase system IIC component
MLRNSQEVEEWVESARWPAGFVGALIVGFIFAGLHLLIEHVCATWLREGLDAELNKAKRE